jgi:hypothetical protein
MKFSEVSVDALTFGPYERRKIDLTGPTRFQIPKLYMPFGLSGFKGDYGPMKWNVDFALKGHLEEGSQTAKFLSFMKSLEARVIQHVADNSEQIFGRPMHFDSVAQMFNSNIKESNQGYEPKFRVKVDTDPTTNFIKPRIFDSNEVDVTSEATDKLHSRQNGVAIVELTSVYFMNRMFGLTWKLHQLKVSPPKSRGAPAPVPDPVETIERGGGAASGLTGFQFNV